jgi:hypothetical protein
MNGKTTIIQDPSSTDEPKKFAFDYSYWSHDGCKEESNGYFGADTSHANVTKLFQCISSTILKCQNFFNVPLLIYLGYF